MQRKTVSGGGSWMDTYGDMVTLLLTFFVCLYSMSSISETQWGELVKAFNPGAAVEVEEIVIEIPQAAGEAIKEKANAVEEPIKEPITEEEKEEPTQEEKALFADLYKLISSYVNATSSKDVILIEQDPETSTIYLQFDNTLLFEPDKSELIESSITPLNIVGDALKQYESDIGKVVIKGYTADVESSMDAWQLSADRALHILNVFKDEKDFPENKLMFSGFGHLYPLAPNDTEEERAKNRRVEIVITPINIDGSADFDGSYFASKANIENQNGNIENQ
ncbi:MAG: flagellar motor protein MotB [Oscillospiraceae bacterium]|jgi:chemotaxis protein MotB|nr:flagellar motor protein MotB [Oscillospiraceae bacterium]